MMFWANEMSVPYNIKEEVKKKGVQYFKLFYLPVAKTFIEILKDKGIESLTDNGRGQLLKEIIDSGHRDDEDFREDEYVVSLAKESCLSLYHFIEGILKKCSSNEEKDLGNSELYTVLEDAVTQFNKYYQQKDLEKEKLAAQGLVCVVDVLEKEYRNLPIFQESHLIG